MKRFALIGCLIGLLFTTSSLYARPSSYLATAEYDSVAWNTAASPTLIFPDPFPDLGQAGSYVDATLDQGVLTIYLLSNTHNLTGLVGNVTYRRSSIMNGAIMFPPNSLYLGVPGSTLNYNYNANIHTITVILSH